MESLVDFVNGKTGAQRLANGDLKPTAGRVDALGKILVPIISSQ